MAKLQTYTVAVNCPACRSSGSARISEEDHRFAAAPWMEIEAISEPFTLVHPAGEPHEILVRCECLHSFMPERRRPRQA